MHSVLASRAALSAVLLFDAAKHASELMHLLFHFGLLGLFLVSIVDSSFVPLPIPGVTDIMVILYAAGHANIFLVVGLATLGSALGGLFSHAVGEHGGKQFLEKHVPAAILKRVTGWMDHHSILAVALPAILPPPVPLSPFVLAAGAGCMSRKRFMLAFTTSRFVRHLLAFWLGVHYGPTVLRLWSDFSNKWGVLVLSIFWAVTLVFTGIGIWRLVKTSRELDHAPARTLKHAATKRIPGRRAA